MESAGGIGEDGVQHLHLTFMTEVTSHEFYLDFTPAGGAAVFELLSMFGTVEGNHITLAGIQTATADLKNKLADFVGRYGQELRHLHRLAKMVRDLEDGKFFLMLSAPAASTAERLRREQLLHRLNNPDLPEQELEQTDSLFDKLLEFYDITQPRTDKRTEIGNPRKQDRICRFCQRGMKEGATFDEEAHAISAALGNQFLKLHDECDDCNGHFGEKVEPSLIEHLNVQRAYLGTLARGSKPTITFANGKMFHDGDRLVIQTTDMPDPASGSFDLSLKSTQEITPLNIYKSLAKSALSVIDEAELPFLRKTAEWVRFDKHGDKPLPKIASAIVPLPPNPSAQITLYVRREGAPSRLPHVVCEFRLGCFLYVYALPFSTKDEWDLIEFFDEAAFKDVFNHYGKVSAWAKEDFSSGVPAPADHIVRLVQKENAPKT